MKKSMCFLISLLLFNFSLKTNNVAYSKSETTTYAKALENCVLYKSEDLKESDENVLFIIPESYFVIVLKNVSDNCFKVQYKKYIGYVSSENVIISTFIPIVKFLDNITFDIKETSGTQVWSKPNTGGRVLTTISAGEKNISYIAYVYGNIPDGGESNLWFYVIYTPNVNSTNVYEGYVYSENTTNLSSIAYNTESNPEVIENEKDKNDDIFYISPAIRTIIVTIIAVPIILFIFIILYNLIKKMHKNTKYNKNENNLENEISQCENVHVENYNNENLKSEIVKFKNLKFIRKKNNKNQRFNVPSFPNYPDDDLL